MGFLIIYKYGIKFEKHHPKYFKYIYLILNILKILLMTTLEIYLILLFHHLKLKTLQQGISQVFVRNSNKSIKKFCLYGLNKFQLGTSIYLKK